MNAAPPERYPLQQQLARIATSAVTAEQWLQALTVELSQTFGAALVAVQPVGGSRPLMFVTDERIAAAIDRDQIRKSLTEPHSSSVRACQLATATQTLRAWTLRLSPKVDRFKTSGSTMLIVPKEITDDFESRLNEFVSTVNDCPWPASKNIAPEQSSVGSSSVARGALRDFHENLDPIATSMRIASQTPLLVGCDRAMVLLANPVGVVGRLTNSVRSPTKRIHQTYRVVAVSGVAVIDRRSRLVRAVESLATYASILRCKLRFEACEISLDSIPPSLTEALEDYFDESSGLSVISVPIMNRRGSLDAAGLREEVESRDSSPMPAAMLLLETFSGPPLDLNTTLIDEIEREASLAICNSVTHANVFALPFRRPLAGLSRTVLRNWVVAGLVFMLVATVAAWTVHVDHTVIATGTARPHVRRAVFAGLDGVVNEIHVADGDKVQAGDLLMTLKSIELDAETESLAGQLATSTERLASLRAMRTSSANQAEGDEQALMEQRTLVREIETLTERLAINQAQLRDLRIISPIDGTVVAWRMEQRLMQRPVNRGDRLLGVIDPSGPWELDLRLSHRAGGDVLQRFGQGETLPVRFAIASQPTRTLHATVRSIGQVARMSEDGSNVIDVLASVAPEDAPEMSVTEIRGDDEVTAKIVCGRERWLTSATTDVVAWFHRNIVFRFWK